MSASKRQAITTLQYVAADMGLDVRRRWFGAPTAEGRFNGVQLRVEVLDSRSGDQAPVAPATATTDDDGEPESEQPPADDRWRVGAWSHHDDLQCGFRITRIAQAVEPEGDLVRVDTGDATFDEMVHVVAIRPGRAELFLDEPTRGLILSFFDSGVEATIGDERIDIVPQLTARALTSRLRNAARMSRLLGERRAEIDLETD